MPDQFEKRLVVEANGDERKEIVVGVGVVSARRGPKGKWRVASLLRAPKWSFTVGRQWGRRLVVCRQRLSERRWGYKLTKTLVFPERSSAFRIELALENTGENVIETDWCLRPLFSLAGHGVPWQSTPYRVQSDLGGEQRKMILRRAAAVPVMPPPGVVRGWLTTRYLRGEHGELGGERWCGTGAWGENVFFAMNWDFYRGGDEPVDKFLRLREWLGADVYTMEPFTTISLKPGETRSWHVDVIVGSGLRSLSRAGIDGALHVEQLRGGNEVQVSFAPSSPVRKLLLTFNWRRAETKAVRTAVRMFDSASPDHPITAVFDLGDDVPPVLTTTWVTSGTKVLQSSSDWLLGSSNRFDALPSVTPPKQPILSVGNVAERAEAAYVRACMKWAGIGVKGCAADRVPANLAAYAAVFWAAADPVPTQTAARLAQYVRSGGGLIVCRPEGLAGSPAAEVLPVTFETDKGKPVTAFIDAFPWRPQLSGEPQAECVWKIRAHLKAVREHPIVRGLPLWPGSYQHIARLCLVRAKPRATTVLAYALPKGFSWKNVKNGAPALVVWKMGRGRVAAFMSPVYWGNPPEWILWGSFAQFHRQLFVNMVRWACGAESAQLTSKTGGLQ